MLGGSGRGSLSSVPCCARAKMYILTATIVECDTRRAGRPQSF